MVPWSLTTTSRTVASVITTADAKDHLRVDNSDEDSLIDRLVLASIDAIEARIRSSMVPASLILLAPRFPTCAGYFALPRAPVRSITSITYVDSDGTQQTMDGSDYVLNGDEKPATVGLSDPSSVPWPTDLASRRDAVRIRYEAGPATINDVSDSLVAATMLMIGHLYENRQAVVTGTIATKVPDAVEALIARHQIPNGELGVIDG
jgi:uncharacterized phiE125 gp8 family phage protein